MNNYAIIIFIAILLFIFISKQNEEFVGYMNFPSIHRPIDYNYGKSNINNIQSVDSIDSNPNALFSAHPRKLVYSYDQNEWTKHIRLNHGGGVMYTSNNPPSEAPSCKEVTCPHLVQDLNTLKQRDHYDPYPLRKDKLKCWECIDKF